MLTVIIVIKSSIWKCKNYFCAICSLGAMLKMWEKCLDKMKHFTTLRTVGRATMYVEKLFFYIGVTKINFKYYYLSFCMTKNWLQHANVKMGDKLIQTDRRTDNGQRKSTSTITILYSFVIWSEATLLLFVCPLYW